MALAELCSAPVLLHLRCCRPGDFLAAKPNDRREDLQTDQSELSSSPVLLLNFLAPAGAYNTVYRQENLNKENRKLSKSVKFQQRNEL